MTAIAVPDERVISLVDRPRVRIIGSPLFVAESVTELLSRSGHRVSDQPDVVVLVTPDDQDWKDHIVGGNLPAVLLYEGSLSEASVVTAVARGVGALAPLDQTDEDALIDLVARVASGDIVLDHAQRVAVVNALRSHHLVTVTLTDREADILNCVEQGCSVKQTARVLGISPKTVENTQRHMFKKLGVRNRSQAVSRAHALGLLPVTS